jgi:hypothetical protein
VLSSILSASVARHAAAFAIIASAAATTMVAGAVDQTAIQLQEQTTPMTVSVAVATEPEPTSKSEVTLTVITKSATPETSQRPQASPIALVRTTELEALVKDCLTKYAAVKTSTTASMAASEACRRAIEASGLTSTEFWARFARGTEPTTAPEKPSARPSTKPSTSPATNVEALAQYCMTRYAAAKESATEATAASEVCRRAIEASGLSTTEFWAKFGTPQAPKATPKTTAAPTATPLTQLMRYCLTLHAALTSTSSHERVEQATSVCNQAIAESRLTPAEFWAKFSATR